MVLSGRIFAMQDHELYAAILGIQSPWRVESVELQLESGEVHVRLGHEDGEQWPCAECGSVCRLYDHQAERRWRILTPVSTARFFTPSRRAASAPNMG